MCEWQIVFHFLMKYANVIINPGSLCEDVHSWEYKKESDTTAGLCRYLPFVLSMIPPLSCNPNSLKDDWVVIVAMTLNVSLCLAPDWIIYAWVKWSDPKLLESCAISISATASFRGHDLCLAVSVCVIANLKGWTVCDNNGRLIGNETNDTEDTENGEMERKQGAHEGKKKRVTAVGGSHCLSAQGSKMSVFVLNQWVMVAIIPPNGYKQAILAHCFHTQMKQAEFSTVGIPRASMENGVWKHASHEDWWGEI